MIQFVKTRNKADFNLTVRWISGHSNVQGNEKADKEVKKASEGPNHNSPEDSLPKFLCDGLPSSISAVKQAHKKRNQERWEHTWSNSPRHARMATIDPKILNHSFIKLVKKLPKRLISLYIYFRTRHIGLNAHLHRINRSETPHCPSCGDVNETIQHFLFICPQYNYEHHILANALGHKATSLSFLLADPKAMAHFLKYVNSTGHLKPTFGDVLLPP